MTENYNSSDSSDDEYYHRAKSKYAHRSRKSHKADKYAEKMDKLLADISYRDRHCPDGTSHNPTSRPLTAVDNNRKYELPKSRSSRPRLHTPVGAENNEIDFDGNSYIEAGATNLFKVPFQKSVSTSNVPSVPTHHRVEPKQAFIKSTSQGHFTSKPTNQHQHTPLHQQTHQPHQSQPSNSWNNSKANPPSNNQQTPLNQSHNHPYPTHHAAHTPHPMSRAHMYDQFSPNSLQQIINHSLHSYSAANEAFIHEDEVEEEEEDGPIQPEGQQIKIVVGYIG